MEKKDVVQSSDALVMTLSESFKKVRRTAKICLFGEGGVGKTSLIRRYVEDIFDDKYITTIGTKISNQNFKVATF